MGTMRIRATNTDAAEKEFRKRRKTMIITSINMIDSTRNYKIPTYSITYREPKRKATKKRIKKLAKQIKKVTK